MTIYLSTKLGSGLYPTLKAAQLPSAAVNKQFAEINVFPGFSLDGDWFRLPDSLSTTISYYNSSDVLQWSKDETDADANCDQWVGFYIDYTDNLLYAIAVDVGTTPNTYYTISINAAGTVVNIGNAQPTSDFSTDPDFNGVTASAGDSIIQRAAEGSGNLFMRIAQTGFEEAEVDISDGSFVSDPADQSGELSTVFNSPYKSADGIYIGKTDSQVIVMDDLAIPIGLECLYGTGFPNEGGASERDFKIMEWGDYIGLVQESNIVGADKAGPYFFLKTVFDLWLKTLARNIGATES